jgi:hypothetical protein
MLLLNTARFIIIEAYDLICALVSFVRRYSGTKISVDRVLKMAYFALIMPVPAVHPTNLPRVNLIFPVIKSL